MRNVIALALCAAVAALMIGILAHSPVPVHRHGAGEASLGLVRPAHHAHLDVDWPAPQPTSSASTHHHSVLRTALRLHRLFRFALHPFHPRYLLPWWMRGG